MRWRATTASRRPAVIRNCYDRGRARMALSVDCLHDPELHALLTTRSPVRATVLEQARRLLA